MSPKSKKKLVVLISFVLLLIIAIIIVVVMKNKKKFEHFENNKKYSDGLNNADKILFINLENRKDRFKSITNQLNNNGVKKDKIERINAHYTPGNGHLGCSKSHYDAMQYAIDNNLDNVIVFEDDFIFSISQKEIEKQFNDLFNNVDKNEWDIILFTHTWGKEENTKYPFLKSLTGAQTSSGYIVNKHYFKTLQSVFKKSSDNMSQEKTRDVNHEPFALDQIWKENQNVDKWFVFSPHLGKQDDTSISTIQSITNYNNKK